MVLNFLLVMYHLMKDNHLKPPQSLTTSSKKFVPNVTRQWLYVINQGIFGEINISYENYLIVLGNNFTFFIVKIRKGTTQILDGIYKLLRSSEFRPVWNFGRLWFSVNVINTYEFMNLTRIMCMNASIARLTTFIFSCTDTYLSSNCCLCILG